MAELDRKANRVFGGRVVRKDLVRKAKVGTNVPVFVLEYLLGKYCATDDQAAIELGMKVVNQTIAENYVRSDEAMKAQATVQQKGRHSFIDKVKVRYVAEDDKYWAELVQFGHKYVHVPDRFVRDYDRLLLGGIWAQVELRHTYDEAATGKRSPFWIDEMTPIQLAEMRLEEYRRGRAEFTADEWLDLLVRSVGLEPAHFDRRLKLLLLSRLIPMVEANYNFVELGPRGTGKSFVYQELSPYVILLTGVTTVANLFYNIATGKLGLVGLWDAVAFDEVADLEKMPKEVVTTLKTYCESGAFARGKEVLRGDASIAMFGNTNQPVEVMVRSSHLFAPMPGVVRDDWAFLDRIHFYLPGWEIPKMRNDFLTDHYGFVSDYLAEGLKELRRQNLSEALDRHFALGNHLNARDAKAVRKTVAGYLKLLHPHGDWTGNELREYLEVALEGRRRVKEQLKKLGSYEYYQTSFSYIDQETREERYVGVPEEGGRNLISTDPLAPGSVYAASVADDGRVALYRIEVGTSAGTGRLRPAGGMDASMRECLQRAFAFIQGRKVEFGAGADLDTTDFHVQGIDLLGTRLTCDAGVAFFVALYSALKKVATQPALVILGDMTIQGNLKPVRSLAEPLRLAMENGAKRSLIPLENMRHFQLVSADIIERVDPIFYKDPLAAAYKALGIS
jgi:ATP-dependent Lon protease